MRWVDFKRVHRVLRHNDHEAEVVTRGLKLRCYPAHGGVQVHGWTAASGSLTLRPNAPAPAVARSIRRWRLAFVSTAVERSLQRLVQSDRAEARPRSGMTANGVRKIMTQVDEKPGASLSFALQLLD